MLFNNKLDLEKSQVLQLFRRRDKEVLKQTDLALSKAFQSLTSSLKSHQEKQSKELFLSNFCELLKNHQLSCGREAIETRVNTPRFSSDLIQFLNKYGVKFTDGTSCGS